MPSEVAPSQSSTSTQPSLDGAFPKLRSTRPVGGRRWIWLVLSGISFAVATSMAFLQPARDNPMDSAQTTLQWFKEPIERNSWRRLPLVDSDLLRLFFTDKLNGWAVGDSGTILCTNNGGASWKPQNSGTSQRIYSVHFIDVRHGWIVDANGTIQATIDGGATWKRQNSGTANPLTSIDFADASRGWAVGANGTILATSDGGMNWNSQTSHTTQWIYTVQAVDATHGWAVGEAGTILTTSDGGTTWRLQTSGTSQQLYYLHFVDASHGWVVGANGTILATSDGGTNWKSQSSGTFENLYSVRFANANRGWAVGIGGTILATRNGGVNWEPQPSRTLSSLGSVYFADANRGWAVGAKGTILATDDAGANWIPQISGASAFASVHFHDASHGWAVGKLGTILATRNGGVTWEPQTSGTSWPLGSVYFADANRGWAVGNNGTILATINGGTTWKSQTSGTPQSLASVHFSDVNHGWTVGGGGIILATTDGGASWKPQNSGTSTFLNSVHFPDAIHGWAVGEDGTILTTSDGGTSWKPQTLSIKPDLLSVHFFDANSGWAVGGGGAVLATSNGGASWNVPNPGTNRHLYSVQFSNANHGWAVGEAGTILTTSDGGTSWKPQTSGTAEDLYSVHFSDVNHGWTVGQAGTILATSDGGENWHGPAPPSRSPARWYYVALLLCVLVAVPALKPEIVVRPIDSAANRQVSDNPIGPGELDALGLGEIALGLSQFFRNVDTKPPLTVGVLGEWGQGKSSVMRLLEADLKKNGVYPVWFNAWHYQKEDHLLAYLLEAIRKQAVPRLHTLQGLRFRARLLGLRATRSRWTLATLVILLAFCAGLLRHPEATAELTEWLGNFRKWSSVALGQLTILGLSVGTALLFLKQIYEALGAFHVNPAALIKEAAGSASIKDLGAKTNLRAAFAKEFRDVTRALEPYRMVIFIDDLDRCNPRSVTQILESVNFLTSAGDCFIVMGLAKPQVAASVGLSFKDVAEELGDGPDAKKKRRDYAQQYLRKLINLEVKVPTATPEQQGVLLAGRAANELSKPRTYAERLVNFGRANRPLAWVLGTAVLASASLWYGLNLKFEAPALPPAQTLGTQGPAASRRPAKLPGPSASKEHPGPEERGPAVFVPGISEVRHLVWLPVLPGLMLLGFGIWVLTRRPNEIIQDSKRFTEALELWQPVIGVHHKTPREIKRFLNRVRYIAMRWRRPSSQKAPFERFADWLQARVKHTRPSPEEALETGESSEVNEAGLVLMAALEEFGGEKCASNPELTEKVHDEIAGKFLEHSQRFGGHEMDWKRFREITGEVEAN